MNPFRALQGVLDRRRLRRIAKRRLAEMLSRDGLVKITVQRPDHVGVPFAHRPVASTYRLPVSAGTTRRAS